MPYGAGCPWAHLRTVDISDPAHTVVVGEYKLPEDDPATGASVLARTAFTAHNAPVTDDLALVTWYAGGLHGAESPRGQIEQRPRVMSQDAAGRGCCSIPTS